MQAPCLQRSRTFRAVNVYSSGICGGKSRVAVGFGRLSLPRQAVPTSCWQVAPSAKARPAWEACARRRPWSQRWSQGGRRVAAPSHSCVHRRDLGHAVRLCLPPAPSPALNTLISPLTPCRYVNFENDLEAWQRGEKLRPEPQLEYAVHGHYRMDEGAQNGL